MDGQDDAQGRSSADPQLRDIPVVMMTGVADEQQMQQAAANGANSYTLKPANAEQFLRTVLASTNYWLTIHQYPDAPPAAGRSAGGERRQRLSDREVGPVCPSRGSNRKSSCRRGRIVRRCRAGE